MLLLTRFARSAAINICEKCTLTNAIQLETFHRLPNILYNSLLFLRKEGFFAEDAVKIDERLEIMREKVKTFKGYTSASQASDEDSD